MSAVLARVLESYLHVGSTDDVALARIMNLSITDTDGKEVLLRRRAVVAMADAMARHLGRLRRRALFAGSFALAWRLGRLRRIVGRWLPEADYAVVDPDADMLRIRSLQLQLDNSGLVEARELRAATAAMARVGLAGSSPVH